MSDDKVTYGEINLEYTPVNEEGEKLEKVFINSPKTLLDDSRKLIHILNQKSDSGRGLYQACIDYISKMVDTKNIPLNAKMTVKNDDHCMVVILEDYFNFITASGNITLESFGSKVNEINDSWIPEPEVEAEVE